MITDIFLIVMAFVLLGFGCVNEFQEEYSQATCNYTQACYLLLIVILSRVIKRNETP